MQWNRKWRRNNIGKVSFASYKRVDVKTFVDGETKGHTGAVGKDKHYRPTVH